MSDSLPEGYGQGDTGVSEENLDSTAVAGNEVTEESSISPVWTKALENIPQEFHSQLLPTFKEWDGNYGKTSQELAAYKQYSPFLEHKVPAEHIEQSLELAHLLQTNPRGLFDYLQEQHGFTPAEAKAAVDAEQDFDVSTDGYSLEKDPRFIQQQKQIETLTQYNQQQDQQRMEAQMRTSIDAEVKTVAERFPMFDIADVAAMATGLANANGTMPNLVEAAQHMATKLLPKERASDGAPPTISGNRGIPSSQKSFGDMTSDERSAYVAAHLEAQNRQ